LAHVPMAEEPIQAKSQAALSSNALTSPALMGA
jgi:hypothetical protein